MSIKIVSAILLSSLAFLSCGNISDMLPDKPPDYEESNGDLHLLHHCVIDYNEWLSRGHRHRGVSKSDGRVNAECPDMGNGGTGWTHEGVKYSYSNRRGCNPSEYEFGDWITVKYSNSSGSSDMPIDFVYLCFDSNFVETPTSVPVFRSNFDPDSTESHVEIAFKFLPELQQVEEVDQLIVAAIVFADGHTGYHAVTTLWKTKGPKTWNELFQSE